MQEMFIGLGFAVAIGGLLISLALYFMFTALSEITYFLSVICVNTNNQNNESEEPSKGKTEIEENIPDKSDENDETYYDFNCPNCDTLLSFAKWQTDENSDVTCPNCNHNFHLFI